MRILAVTNTYPTPQSPEFGTYVEQQIKGLKQIGLDVDVMFVDRVHRGVGVYLGLGRRVRARVAAVQPELVHVMYGSVMADEVTRAVTDRPTVVSFCGADLLREPFRNYLKTVMAQYAIVASHRAARRVTGIVVKSQNLYAALPNDVDRSKVQLIPNGIDLERFKPLNREACRARLGWHPDRFHVLFPANLDTLRKGPDLARAAVEVAARSGIPIELHPLRGVAHHDVPIWMNASDVVLLTSLQEGSPNVIKEALACDMPVVSVDVGDVRERIQGIAGCYVAAPQAGDLAARLRSVYAGPRRVASRVTMQDLSLEQVALRLKEFYGEVLGSRQTAADRALRYA